MAVPMPAAIAPPPAPVAVDAARFALVQSIRLWKIEVRLAAEKLLSLGQPFEVQYTFPRVRVPGAAGRDREREREQEHELRGFGFNVMPVAGSHLFQVNEVRSARFPQRFVEPGSERPSAIASIGLNDYLVGVGADNLLLSSMKMPRLRRRVSDILQCAEREQAAGRASSVRLKFVRYDNQVRVDPLQQRSHSQILQILDEIDAYQARLAKQYEALVTRHRDAKKQLQVEKKVLLFVRIILHETRNAVMQVDEFKFMAGFRSWFKGIHEPFPEDDFDDDVEGEASNFEFGVDAWNEEMATTDDVAPEIVSIDSPEEEDEHEMIDLTHPDTVDDESSDDEGAFQLLDLAPAAAPRKAPSRTGRLVRTASAHVTHSPRPSSSASPRSRLERTHSLPTVIGAHPQPPRAAPPPPRAPALACDVDVSWINSFPMQDLKWLGNARKTLKMFTNGVADSFQGDYEGDARIPPLSCAIAETLFRLYLRKRGHMSNPAMLQKEFTRHARMLRSNIKNVHNPELRRDLVNGNITPQRLCEMTSDELAPEALRRERELRFEQHARQNILREPTGVRLIKTKHGFKEVGFDQSDADAETAALPTLNTINLGRLATPSSDTDAHAPVPVPVSSSAAGQEVDAPMTDTAFEPDVEDDRTSIGDDPSPRPRPGSSVDTSHVEKEVSERFQESMGIRSKQPAKKVSFAPDTVASTVQPQKAGQTPATRQADEKPPTKNHTRKQRAVTAVEGKAFLITLFGPTYDVISQLQDWANDLGRVSLASMSREFNLAPGVKVCDAATCS